MRGRAGFSRFPFTLECCVQTLALFDLATKVVTADSTRFSARMATVLNEDPAAFHKRKGICEVQAAAVS